MIAIKRFSSLDSDFEQKLDSLLAFESAQDESIDRVVASILEDVKARGDAAVVEFTNRFDRLSVRSLDELELSPRELNAALDGLPIESRKALGAAASRIDSYHRHQPLLSWQYEDTDAGLAGIVLGQKITRSTVSVFTCQAASCLSIIGVDECYSRESGGCRRVDHGCSDAGRGA